MSEITTSNLLYISVLDEQDEVGYQHLNLNTRNFLKFYTNENTITYSPIELVYKFVEFKNGRNNTLVGAKVQIEVKGIDRATGKEYSYAPDLESTNIQSSDSYEYRYTFPQVVNNQAQLIDIDSITFSVYVEKTTDEWMLVGYEEILVMYGTTEDMAKFKLTASNISMAVANAGLVFDSNGLTITNGSFLIKDEAGNSVFCADEEGNLSFTGRINSNIGNLSGWELGKNDIHDERGFVGLHSGETRFYQGDDKPVRFWAGISQEEEIATIDEEETGEIITQLYNFAVTSEGTLYANDAKILGNIEATGGRIINEFYIGPNNATGIVILGTETESSIGSMQYASGALGSGWKIKSDGSAEFNNVSIRGKITSSVFEYNHISAVGGSLYIAPTLYTQKASNIITQQNSKYIVSWTLDVPVANAFGSRSLAEGDYLLIDGSLIVGTTMLHLSDIQAIVNEQPTENSFSVSFEYSGQEVLTNATFEPGTTIIFYGTAESRDGLYLTAIGKDSPYLDVYSSLNSAESEAVPAVRLGNLTGITDANFAAAGSNLSGYGLYSNNAYLRGQLMLPNAGITNQTEEKDQDGSPIRIWAGLKSTSADGKKNIKDAYFRVTEDGTLYAEKGRFKGVVEATNSEFSGSIRAAGILLEEEDTSSTDALHDHFYVAYNILADDDTEFTPSYQNYVLNIDREGLSIWEGGLQAYSDVANENPASVFDAYRYNSTTGEAFPYLYLVDAENSETENELRSRLVINKLHQVNFTPQVSDGQTFCSVVSTQLNNGLWLVNKSIAINERNYKDAEISIFNESKESGLTLQNKKLLLKNTIAEGYISMVAPFGVQINMDSFDTSKYLNNTLMIGGNVQMVTQTTNKAELKINSSIIQEAKDADGSTIGLNFIAVS